MSIVNTETGELVEQRPELPLQVITPADVRASIRRAKASLEKAADEIVWQIEREAWVTLGYSSWTAMREAEYGGAAFMVPSKQRPELVQRMRDAGLSKRETARTAGVDEGTVRNDLRRTGAENSAPSDPDDDVIDAEIVEDEEPVHTTPDATTGPTPASADPEPITTICPTCNGTGKVTR